MKIISDGTPASLALFGLTPSSEFQAADNCMQQDRQLWQALAGHLEMQLLPTIESVSSDFWSRLFLVGKAARSQFDTLRDLLGQGLDLQDPVACLAVAGRGFHGHRDREWVAAPGNLHLSVALPSTLEASRCALAMTMLPAVAVVDALGDLDHGCLRPGIKWVNDILLQGKKVAGVLTSTQTLADKLQHVILGIGINVAVTPSVAGTPFVPAVCSLEEEIEAGECEFPEVLAAVLNALASRYDELAREGPGPLFTAYHQASVILGQEVCIWAEGVDGAAPADKWPSPLATGRVEDIAPDLTLRLEGHSEPVDRGRLAFRAAWLDFAKTR